MALKVQRIYTSFGERDADEEEAQTGPFDVVVHLSSGEQYIASFFTYASIEVIRKENRRSGACLNGVNYRF